MIVILEGPDNSGKSTLAKRLAADLGLAVCHPGGPPKNIAEALARCVEQDQVLNQAECVSFIYDRVTCISDMIYRGDSQYRTVFSNFIDKIGDKPDVMLIYCRPSDERLKNFDDHVMQAHEDEKVVEHAKNNVDRIIAEYDTLFKPLKRRISVFEYNFENDKSSVGYKSLRTLIFNAIRAGG